MFTICWSSRNYEGFICEDGINADRYPSDYILYKKQVNKNTRLPLKMAPGGGYVLRLQKK
jgi:alpha-glucosidase